MNIGHGGLTGVVWSCLVLSISLVVHIYLTSRWPCLVFPDLLLSCNVLSGHIWFFSGNVEFSGIALSCLMILHCLVWFFQILSGLVWFCLVLSGLAWSCLVLSGLVWSCLILSGLVWSRLVLWAHCVDVKLEMPMVKLNF